MAKHHELGKSGENAAVEFLISRGYSILHTNWHWGHNELDIVAMDNEELVVVEVKTRNHDHLEEPESAVNSKKINRIVNSANVYVRYFRIDLPVRFDIITLIAHGDEYEIEHLDNAFYAPLRRR